VQRGRAGRARGQVGADLVVVAEVDHGAHAVGLERGPARRAQAVERVAAHDRAAADDVAVGGAQAAKVADVGAAFPLEMSGQAEEFGSDERSASAAGRRTSRTCSDAVAGELRDATELDIVVA